MIEQLPLFRLREWATTFEEGHLCPSCAPTAVRLEQDGGSVRCPRCQFNGRAGWHRHYYSEEPPTLMSHGYPFVLAAPSFGSLQHYLRRPGPDEEEPYHLADFLIDIDAEGDLPRARAIAERVCDYLDSVSAPYQLHFSGNKGFHVQVPWQALRALPSTVLNHRTYRVMAQRLVKDLGIEICMTTYIRRKLFRNEGSRHQKSGLYKTRLLRSELSLPDEELLAIAARPQRSMKELLSGKTRVVTESAALTARYKDALAVTPEGGQHVRLQAVYTAITHPACVRQALAEGPPDRGTRHTLNMTMAAYWASIGGPPEEFLGWAERTPGKSPTPKSERVREASQALRWAQQRRPPFRCDVMQRLDLCDPACPFRNS
jgi:hypothetical protein